MQILYQTLVGLALLSGTGFAQETFIVTGTNIPADLLKLNYGPMPPDIQAFDLTICNATTGKQSVTSSEIYQALSQSNSTLLPIGRQIMLAAILRNQNRSVVSIASLVLKSAAGVFSVLASVKNSIPSSVLAGAALGSLSAQQIVIGLKPVLTADQVEKFESQVLEPALVLDGGSCVERTVFTVVETPKSKPTNLSFHIR